MLLNAAVPAVVLIVLYPTLGSLYIKVGSFRLYQDESADAYASCRQRVTSGE